MGSLGRKMAWPILQAEEAQDDGEKAMIWGTRGGPWTHDSNRLHIADILTRKGETGKTGMKERSWQNSLQLFKVSFIFVD